MRYVGDYAEDATVYFQFTTSDSNGGAVAPSTAFEAADLVIYKDNGVAQKTSTNGITMTSPFDSVTGLHAVTIDTSNDTGDAGFWVTGADYMVVLSPDETVDSQTVVAVVCSFSIENRFSIPAGIESDIQAIEVKTSDTHSRLVVVETAIDSDQTSRTAAISDVKSELVIVSTAIATLDTAVDSDQVSRTAAISDVKSRLVVVEAAIDSDQTSRTSAISDVHSRLVVVETAIDSDQVSRTAAISDVKSELVIISAAVATVDAAIDSDQVSRTAAISDVKSRLVVVESAIDSDQTSRTAAISDVHSRLVVVESSIDSDQTSRTAALSDIKSEVSVITTDAHTEPSGAPAANESPLDKLGFIFAALRNKVTVTSSAKTFFTDAGASQWSKGLADNGTTYTEDEGA
jgi:hypothetical protein